MRDFKSSNSVKARIDDKSKAYMGLQAFKDLTEVLQ